MKEKLSRKHLIVLIALCGMLASSVGLVQNVAGIFFDPLAESLGVGRGPVALTLTIYVLLSAFGSLFFNRLIRCIEAEKVVFVSAVLLIAGTFLSGFSNNLFTLYLFSIMRGLGGGFVHIVIASLYINNWFEKNNALMASIAMACSGAAGALFSPLLSFVVENYGFRIGYFVNGALMFLLCAPLLFLGVTYTPEKQGLKPYGYTENKTKQSSEYGNEEESGNFIFILVLIYSIIVGFLTCVPQFFPGHAAKLNYAVSVGSLMVSMSMVANIVAKISFGALSDKIGPKKSILITSAIALIGTLFLLLDINMYIGAFCYGFCFANSTVGLTALTREQFPLKDYVKKYPFISFVSTIVNAFGSPIAGFVYDQSGSYTPVFVACLVMLVILFGVDFTIMAENRKKEGKR